MHATHIAAYVYSADVYCPDCIAATAERVLRENGYADEIEDAAREGSPVDVGVFALRAEGLLARWAKLDGINQYDPYSYDSDDFPKVVLADSIEDGDRCGGCGEGL